MGLRAGLEVVSKIKLLLLLFNNTFFTLCTTTWRLTNNRIINSNRRSSQAYFSHSWTGRLSSAFHRATAKNFAFRYNYNGWAVSSSTYLKGNRNLEGKVSYVLHKTKTRYGVISEVFSLRLLNYFRGIGYKLSLHRRIVILSLPRFNNLQANIVSLH